ncbi:MAG: dihydroorotate dehydrogenase electron transfer subunit [Actinomycetota bacterium]
MIPIAVSAPVVGSTRMGDYHVLTFRDFDIARGARPGQFVNVATDRFLRRPFSVYRADPSTGDIAIAFDAIGPGTGWLAGRAAGDRLDVVGPLGHGFEVPQTSSPDLVVGGGYGSAALSFLAEQLAARGRRVHAILGARTAARLFVDDALRTSCASVELTTDDGSAGARGFVTDVMQRVIEAHEIGTIFACGTMPMLRAVSETAKSVPAQLAVEEFMACGIGVCWTCVLPVHANGSRKHLRSCTEGPVFKAANVAWA